MAWLWLSSRTIPVHAFRFLASGLSEAKLTAGGQCDHPPFSFDALLPVFLSARSR